MLSTPPQCTLRELSTYLNVCYESIVVGLYRVRGDTLLPYVTIPRSDDVVEARDAVYALVPRQATTRLLRFAHQES